MMKLTKKCQIILIVLLALNAIFLLYAAFMKKNAVDMEIMKSGGRDNFNLVEQLYTNPSYISQQTQGIQQGLESFGVK